jgi:hypothetical protein
METENENRTEKINIDNNINSIKLQKMLFFYNSLEDGWTIKKRNNTFIFTKKHEGKREFFLESYLYDFMKKNMDTNKLLNSEKQII